jgi:hypothetical protein
MSNASKLPSTQNSPYTKVAYFVAAYSDPLQFQRTLADPRETNYSVGNPDTLDQTSERGELTHLHLQAQEAKVRDVLEVSTLCITEEKSEILKVVVKRLKAFPQLVSFKDEDIEIYKS